MSQLGDFGVSLMFDDSFKKDEEGRTIPVDIFLEGNNGVGTANARPPVSVVW